jgi:hypothetical protein
VPSPCSRASSEAQGCQLPASSADSNLGTLSRCSQLGETFLGAAEGLSLRSWCRHGTVTQPHLVGESKQNNPTPKQACSSS